MLKKILSFSLVAGVLLGSCQGNDPVTEDILVSPEYIDAQAQMGSYKIQVTSNAKWSVSVENDLPWVTLDRSSGHDNASMTVRVNDNKYKDPRRASIVFKTAGGLTASVSLVQAGDDSGEETPDANTLRLGSYNLRMSGLDTDGNNVWDLRKERLKQSILDCDFDVFGIQEVSSVTQAWLDSELASKYTFKYFSPYAQTGKGDKAQGIGYRKDAFTLSDWHFFWASDTPDTMTYNDTGDNGNFKRGGCCCILTHKATGIKLFFMNNHGCLNAESNTATAHVYAQMEQKYNAAGLPSFFVGDMNARESAEEGSVYMTFTSWWKDSFKELTPASRQGPANTYNGYSSTTGKSRIDFVFYRGEGFQPMMYCCNNSLYEGLYASDHFPVWVEFAFEK